MEKQPSFSRIIGGTEEQRKTLKDKAEEMAVISGEEAYGEELLVSTEEEKELIGKALEYANATAESFGSTRIIDPQRVFVLRDGAVMRLTGGDISGGVQNSFKQITGIERNTSPIVFALTVVHEACHGVSYSSAQVLRDGTDRPYRQGISMRERDGNSDKTYFKQAEEAIVTTFARKFYDEVLVNDPRYQEEIAQTLEIKAWLTSFIKRNAAPEKQREFLSVIDDIIALPNNENLYKMIVGGPEDEAAIFGYFQGFYQADMRSGSIMRERSKERRNFEKVLERIIHHSSEVVTNQELFDDFARAHFTGNYLPLAKKIEEIMGVGSFREIATELGVTRAAETT